MNPGFSTFLKNAGLILLFVGVIIGIIFTAKAIANKKTTRRPITERGTHFMNLNEAGENYMDSQARLRQTAEENGLDSDLVLEEMGLKPANENCLLSPDEEGKCPGDKIRLNTTTGCCELPSGATKVDEYEFLREIALSYLMGEIAEEIIEYIGKMGMEYLTRKIQTETTELVVEQTTKQGVKRIVNKATQETVEFTTTTTIKTFMRTVMKTLMKTTIFRIIHKVIAQIVKNVIAKIIARIIALIIKTIITAIVKLMSVYGTITMVGDVLDLFDTQGYNLFSSNGFNLKIRNNIEYNFQKLMVETGRTYPCLLDMNSVYPLESALVDDNIRNFIFDNVRDTIPDSAYDALLNGDDTQFKQIFEEYTSANHLELNKKKDQLLRELLPSNMEYEFKVYESFSKPNTNAVSLTEESAIKWNNAHRAAWFEYLEQLSVAQPIEERWKDAIGVERDDYTPPFAIAFTNTYGEFDRTDPNQSESNPSMTQRVLSERVPLAGMYYVLFKQCESPRAPIRLSKEQAQGAVGTIAQGMMELQHIGGARIDPRDYGVHFNPETRTCKYTREYCQRFGLEYKSSGAEGTSDCKLYPGQYYIELILPLSITRTFIRAFQDPEQFIRDLTDPKENIRQWRRQIYHTGDLIERKVTRMADKADEFIKDFEKDPVGAVRKSSAEGVREVAGVAGAFREISPLSGYIEDGLNEVANLFHKKKKSKPAIFFQITGDPYEMVVSHTEDDVGEFIYIRSPTMYMYFDVETNSEGKKYYIDIYNSIDIIVEEKVFPESQIIILTSKQSLNYVKFKINVE